MKRSNVMVANDDNTQISRNDFPSDFIFGTGAAAYQHEGAATRDGRGISIWDKFTWQTPYRIADGGNGNVAVDMYDRFKSDIDTMKKMGLDSFRFSISWPRILPGGRRSAGVNQEGIDYYNQVIDTLLANGLEPFVTLFHWDLPQTLQDDYGGFLSPLIQDDFREYVELCFWEFGDRVKYWVTLNETWTYCHHGYAQCIFPPSPHGLIERPPPSTNSSSGQSHIAHRAPKSLLSLYHNSNNAATNGFIHDPSKDKYSPKNAYTAAKYMLLAHATAVESYRTKYQQLQGGKIGITLVSHWFEPLSDSPDDIAAAGRAVDFMLGWFLEPIMKGKYPDSMTKYGAENIAEITPEEFKKIQGSIDFLGLNYYTTYYATNNPDPEGRNGYIKDQHLTTLGEKDGVPIGPVASGSDWLYIVPQGIQKLLNYVNEKYINYANNDLSPPIYITENGVDEINNPKLTPTLACIDPVRTKYHQDHLAYILKAMTEDSVNIKGYFAWSWCDNFEWAAGYESRFGFMYVDFKNHLARYPKDSALWFSKFLMRNPNPASSERVIKFVDTKSMKN